MVADILTGTPHESTLYQAPVDGQGLYMVLVTRLSEPILSDQEAKAFFDGYLSSKLSVLQPKSKALRKGQVFHFGKRALAYEYDIPLDQHTMCSKGVYVLGEQFGYEVSVLFRKNVEDAILPHYRAFVSSFRVSPSTGAEP